VLAPNAIGKAVQWKGPVRLLPFHKDVTTALDVRWY